MVYRVRPSNQRESSRIHLDLMASRSSLSKFPVKQTKERSTQIPPIRSPSAAPNAAEQKTESLSRFLLLSSHGSLLITSRSRNVALALTGAEDDIITVEPMDESHASALFGKKLGSGHDKQQVA